jgi:hypothetical protein
MRGLGSGEGPYFRVMNGPKEGEKIEVADAQELVFGRDETADIVLKDDLVSRRHAKVRRDWSGTHVEDLESRNGIKVNKKRVARKTLRDRDELEVGGIRLLYLDPSEVREAPVVLPDAEDEAESTSHSLLEEPPPPDPEPEPEPEPEPAPEAGGPEAGAPDEQADDEQSHEDEPEEEQEEEEEEEPAPGRFGKLKLKNTKALVPVLLVVVAGLVALVLLIALFVGA